MFNWIISSKKKDDWESEDSSQDEEILPERIQPERIQIENEIPHPPASDLEVALRVRQKKYFPTGYPDDMSDEIIEAYINRQIQRLYRQTMIRDLSRELLFVYKFRKDRAYIQNYFNDFIADEIKLECQKRQLRGLYRSAHNISTTMICDEIEDRREEIEEIREDSIEDVREKINIELDSESSEEEYLSRELISREKIGKETNRHKRARKELSSLNWEEKTAEWGYESSDINLNYGEEIMRTNPLFGIPGVYSQVGEQMGEQVTEEEIQKIANDIGDWNGEIRINFQDTKDEWDSTEEMPDLVSDSEEMPDLIDDSEEMRFHFIPAVKPVQHVTREHPEGYLELFIGPMFSGKSSKILFKLSSMADQRFRCLYVNSVKDVRDTEVQDSAVTTHNSSYSSLSSKITSVKVSNLNEVDVRNYDYIAVDEFQFYDDDDAVRCVRDWVGVYGKYVLVASLDGDAYRRKFGRVLELIPQADEITKLTAYCDLCRDNRGIVKKAPFTARMTSDTTAELVGGKDMYKAMCRSCHDFHLQITVSQI